MNVRWPNALMLLVPVTALAVPASAQRLREIHLTGAPGAWQIEPGRTVQNGWLWNGQLPGPEIRVTEGDRVRVHVHNRLPDVTTVHWHGLPVPLAQDGVPGISQGPIGVGQDYVYEFDAIRPGTYWYHPHVDVQIDRGLAGPLIIEPRSPNTDPPFDREYTVVFDDWLPGAPSLGQDPVYSDFLINGKTSLGQTPFDVVPGQVVRLRLVNAGGFTNIVFAIDGHVMQVTHADGQPVVPVQARAIPIGAGERYDVYVTANQPGRWSMAVAALTDRRRTLVRGVLAYRGSTGPDPSPSFVPANLSSAPLLTYAQLASPTPNPISAVPDRTYNMDLGGHPMTYVWTIGGQAYPNAQPVQVTAGQSVRFTMTNRTGHWHPMHIHGHFFKVLGSAGGNTHPLIKDTVLVPRRMGHVDVEWVADNPGCWLFHCHMIQHMAAGMMREIHYVPGDVDGDGLPDASDKDPHGGWAVTWLHDAGGTFRPGSQVDLVAQWRPGESLAWFLGRPRTPVDLGALGRLSIAPDFPLGTMTVPASAEGALRLSIPNDPALATLQLGAQAVATHATLAPGYRISRPTLLNVRR